MTPDRPQDGARAPSLRFDTKEYPLLFEPRYQHRVWGGRNLASRFGRTLPEGTIGESWELVDRPEVISLISNGPLKGVDLHAIWTDLPSWFGVPDAPRPDRFPLLVKLLDCQEHLSVQVHPGPDVAWQLGGEPKAEFWYFLETSPRAEIYAGFKKPMTRRHFADLLKKGRGIASALHTLSTGPNRAFFVPPGRIHAIGGGNLLCEVQQNSDTTYRVHDWDRPHRGVPRALHHHEALESITFDDVRPDFLDSEPGCLLEIPSFRIVLHDLLLPVPFGAADSFTLGMVLEGMVTLSGQVVDHGRCFLLPRALGGCMIEPLGAKARLLEIRP